MPGQEHCAVLRTAKMLHVLVSFAFRTENRYALFPEMLSVLLYARQTEIPLTREVNLSLRARMGAVVDFQKP